MGNGASAPIRRSSVKPRFTQCNKCVTADFRIHSAPHSRHQPARRADMALCEHTADWVLHSCCRTTPNQQMQINTPIHCCVACTPVCRLSSSGPLTSNMYCTELATLMTAEPCSSTIPPQCCPTLPQQQSPLAKAHSPCYHGITCSARCAPDSHRVAQLPPLLLACRRRTATETMALTHCIQLPTTFALYDRIPGNTTP